MGIVDEDIVALRDATDVPGLLPSDGAYFFWGVIVIRLGPS